MSETVNIGQISEKISRDILKAFHWEMHPLTNDNFECVHEHHTTDEGAQKKTHPCDVVFHYHDPYLDKRIYLHTDLKSYKKGSVKRDGLKNTLRSLAWTIECANVSQAWKDRYCIDPGENYEVRGLLFVANHDNKDPHEFEKYYSKINREAVPLAPKQMIHVLGPKQLNNLFSIVTDIKLQRQDELLPALYHFHYPDLTLWKRQVGDDTRVAATIETLLSPYFVLKHGAFSTSGNEPIQRQAGSVVYYSRSGGTVEEFVYLLDSLSRAQLVQSREQIRVRVIGTDCSQNLRSNFEQAKTRYCGLWRFSAERAEEIMSITIDTVPQTCPNYSPEKIGWIDR